MGKGKPTKIDWARLAAYIDGEGCIDIHTHRQFNKKLNRVHETKYVTIIIANTDFRLPLWCKEKFKGHVRFTAGRPKPDAKSRYKDQASWHVSSRMAVNIIEQCLPYLLLKREQAEVAMAFQKTAKRVGRGGHSVTTIQKREQLQAEIRELKKNPSTERVLRFPKTGTEE